MSEEIQFGKLIFKKNGVLASGILGVTGWSMAKVAQSGAGGITCKSISRQIRKGHATPVVQVYQQGMLNAVGLSSTGIENSNQELKIARQNSQAVVIASVFGGTCQEFAATIEQLNEENIDCFELNISCPNVADEFGLPFSSRPDLAASVVKAARPKTDLPLLVKLSPNFPGIGQIARACEDEGADGITAINTVGPGMLIDIHTFQPKLSNRVGGVSGAAILPIALRCVYEIYQQVKIPIIGTGGISNVEAAIQMIAAGATLYGIGTALFQSGIDLFEKINLGLDEYLQEKKLSYPELIGITHRH